MDIHRLKELIKKYNEGKASPEEIAAVEEWYAGVNNDKDTFRNEGHRDLLKKGVWSSLNDHISDSEKRPHDKGRKIRKLYAGLRLAAVLLIVFSFGLYLYIQDRDRSALAVHNKKHPEEILPGSNKAVLALGNGKTIDLDDAANGDLARDGNLTIKKSGDGQVIYQVGSNGSAGLNDVSYSTISTPRGGQYQIVLPDGSHVWLNAASSLRFPSAFTGNERSVKLEGEAYFEVAKDKQKPFMVEVKGMKVEVLGTSFNLMAYDEEPEIQTTLLEGSVKVVQGANYKIIKPGQQASVLQNSIDVNDVDTDEITAWKNGLFQFSQAGLETVMHQLGRWYNVDIVFEGKIPDEHFHGKVSRNANLSQVLKILELSGINFTVEGRKIIVR